MPLKPMDTRLRGNDPGDGFRLRGIDPADGFPLTRQIEVRDLA
jgi:hypothetical protein